MLKVNVVGAAIVEDGRCLVAQRGPTMALAGKWEFPGGKVEAGESNEEALAREIHEELGLRVRIEAFLGSGGAAAGSTRIALDVFAATILAGEPQLREHAQAVWVSSDELVNLDWAEADVPVVSAVRAWLSGGVAGRR